MNDRPSLAELGAFAAIARHRSFRAAADELGVSPSTLSHMMRGLEERLGLRLFNRTTRSVAATEAGTRLLANLNPVLSGLDEALADVRMLNERPNGTVRINASARGNEILLRRIIPEFRRLHPDVHLDLVTDQRWVNVIAEGFDIGVRLGEAVPQDMIAVPFGGDERFIAIAAPDYVAQHGAPRTPDDLAQHRCVRFRLGSGKFYRWEFEHRGQEMAIDVSGPITVGTMEQAVQAAAAGIGIAFVISDLAQAAIARGELVTLLDDWTPPFPGYHIYYPSRRLLPSGVRAFVDLVREIGSGA
jgi:DNA-binding transcriptional LysR family regulator